MKLRTLTALAWVFVAAVLLAQTAKPPTLSDSMKEKFWKAQSEFQQAQSAAQQATQAAQQKQVALQAAVDEMRASCGKDYILNLGKDGEPECQVKPVKPLKK